MKLNSNSAREIRTLAKNKTITHGEMARYYGVSIHTIRDVIYRKTWVDENHTYAQLKNNSMITASLISDVLPVAKDLKELNKWCERSTDRIMGDAINPYSK